MHRQSGKALFKNFPVRTVANERQARAGEGFHHRPEPLDILFRRWRPT